LSLYLQKVFGENNSNIYKIKYFIHLGNQETILFAKEMMIKDASNIKYLIALLIIFIMEISILTILLKLVGNDLTLKILDNYINLFFIKK
jgi:hypothetical protein